MAPPVDMLALNYRSTNWYWPSRTFGVLPIALKRWYRTCVIQCGINPERDLINFLNCTCLIYYKLMYNNEKKEQLKKIFSTENYTQRKKYNFNRVIVTNTFSIGFFFVFFRLSLIFSFSGNWFGRSNLIVSSKYAFDLLFTFFFVFVANGSEVSNSLAIIK